MAENVTMAPSKGYWNAADLCKRFRCSKRTLARWQQMEKNPLPAPAMAPGSANLWKIEDIEAWEQKVEHAAA